MKNNFRMPDLHLRLALDTNPVGADQPRRGHGVQLLGRVRPPSDRSVDQDLPERSALAGYQRQQSAEVLPG